MTNKPSYSDEIYNPITKIEDLYQGNVNDQQYDLLVFIGRFQPLHLGHTRVIDIALKKAKKVLVLVGSSYRPSRPRNPWTFAERADMIRAHYKNMTISSDQLLIQPLEDFAYRDEIWVSEVQSLVAEHSKVGDKIGLIGCAKDHSSFYLKLFPQWGSINVRFLNPLNSTDLRSVIFSNDRVEDKADAIRGLIPPIVLNKVVNWIENSEGYLYTKKYHQYCNDYYQKRQAGANYPIQDLTADAVVIQSGHVLLVERKAQPGAGLVALPGGYLNVNERWLDGAIRELREETKIKVPEPVLRGCIKQVAIFDDPNRSERGRIVTQAFKIVLPNNEELPKVKGSDDAAKAKWVPIADLRSDNMFEDHFDIIQYMIN